MINSNINSKKIVSFILIAFVLLQYSYISIFYITQIISKKKPIKPILPKEKITKLFPSGQNERPVCW